MTVNTEQRDGASLSREIVSSAGDFGGLSSRWDALTPDVGRTLTARHRWLLARALAAAERAAPTLPLAHLVVLAALAAHANERELWAAWPSQPRLAREARVCERTVRTALANLLRAGLVARVPRADVHGVRADTYCVLGLLAAALEADFATAKPAAVAGLPAAKFAAQREFHRSESGKLFPVSSVLSSEENKEHAGGRAPVRTHEAAHAIDRAVVRTINAAALRERDAKRDLERRSEVLTPPAAAPRRQGGAQLHLAIRTERIKTWQGSVLESTAMGERIKALTRELEPTLGAVAAAERAIAIAAAEQRATRVAPWESVDAALERGRATGETPSQTRNAPPGST